MTEFGQETDTPQEETAAGGAEQAPAQTEETAEGTTAETAAETPAETSPEEVLVEQTPEEIIEIDEDGVVHGMGRVMTPPQQSASQKPAQTVETRTVEQADADFRGPLSTENAPAFKEPEKAEADLKPIVLPADPDGSVMVGVARDALRNLITSEHTDAKYRLFTMVKNDDATVRALSELVTRILQHKDARKVTEQTLGDVLQGDETEQFAARGLPGSVLLATLQDLTPAAIACLVARQEAAAG